MTKYSIGYTQATRKFCVIVRQYLGTPAETCYTIGDFDRGEQASEEIAIQQAADENEFARN